MPRVGGFFVRGFAGLPKGAALLRSPCPNLRKVARAAGTVSSSLRKAEGFGPASSPKNPKVAKFLRCTRSNLPKVGGFSACKRSTLATFSPCARYRRRDLRGVNAQTRRKWPNLRKDRRLVCKREASPSEGSTTCTPKILLPSEGPRTCTPKILEPSEGPCMCTPKIFQPSESVTKKTRRESWPSKDGGEMELDLLRSPSRMAKSWARTPR